MAKNQKGLSTSEVAALRQTWPIVLCYVLIAGLWVLLSEWLLESAASEPSARTAWSIGKDGLLVFATALLLVALLRLERRVHERDSAGLRESAERLHLVGDNLPDCYLYQYTREADGMPRFLYLSAGVERVIGVTAQEVLHDARALHRLIPAESVSALVALETASLPKLTDFEMEFPMLRADGQWRWVQVRTRPRRRSNGPVVWEGVATDITERKATERALHESEQKYRELVEHANSIILRWNSEGLVTFLNEYGQRFFGYSAEEIIGQHVTGTIVPPTESSGRDLRQLMDQICTDPKAFEQTLNENMRRNGERVWVAWTNKLVLDEQGRMKEILSIGSDITERKRAEDASRRSEDTLRSVFRAVPVGICITNNRVLQSANSRWLEMVGYSKEEIIGQGPRRLYESDQECQRVGKALYEDLRQRGLNSVQTRLRRRDGVVRDVVLTAAPLHLDDPSKGDVVVAYLDVTERQRAEEELRAHQAHLEERVLLRTTELAEARDRAEAADRIKSAFLATMSHELRTPLNSIIGFTGIILQGLAGPLNEEQHKQLSMVRDSARHLLALINDVLDISKIEAGQIEIAPKPFDLPEAIRAVSQSVAPLAAKKELSLDVQLAPDVGRVTSDRRRVEQILLNLLSNAVKFTESGTVTLAAERVPGFIRISVTDTGIGIKPEDREKLFLPFRQLDSGLTRQHEGTGLGLAICKRLVERLGGTIEVESQLGMGSTFRFTLPANPESKS